MHQTRRGSTIYWIGAQVAELLLNKALPILVVLQGVRQDLHQGEVLVESRLHFLLVAKNVVEACGQLGASFSVENDLTCANIAVGHSLIVHEVKCAEYLLGEVQPHTSRAFL